MKFQIVSLFFISPELEHTATYFKIFIIAIYQRQKKLNQILKQSENKASSLTHENGSLTDCIAKRVINYTVVRWNAKKGATGAERGI